MEFLRRMRSARHLSAARLKSPAPPTHYILESFERFFLFLLLLLLLLLFLLLFLLFSFLFSFSSSFSSSSVLISLLHFRCFVRLSSASLLPDWLPDFTFPHPLSPLIGQPIHNWPPFLTSVWFTHWLIWILLFTDWSFPYDLMCLLWLKLTRDLIGLFIGGSMAAAVLPAAVSTTAASGCRVPSFGRRRPAESHRRQRPVHAEHDPPVALLVAPDPAHARSPPPGRARGPRC